MGSRDVDMPETRGEDDEKYKKFAASSMSGVAVRRVGSPQND
jgi:hypothetical protein